MFRSDAFDTGHQLVGQVSFNESPSPLPTTLTKAELVRLILDGMGLSKRESKELVDAFFEEISASLAAGEEVKLHGFGNLKLRDKPARPGRNPKTGEGVVISARCVVTFLASPILKSKVRSGGSAAS